MYQSFVQTLDSKIRERTIGNVNESHSKNVLRQRHGSSLGPDMIATYQNSFLGKSRSFWDPSTSTRLRRGVAAQARFQTEFLSCCVRQFGGAGAVGVDPVLGSKGKVKRGEASDDIRKLHAFLVIRHGLCCEIICVIRREKERFQISYALS